jgi:hypothetical protein
MSQKQSILNYLQQGKSITPLEAFDLFKCMRLGARIWDLKQAGYDVKEELVHDQRSKKHFSKYWINQEKQLTLKLG